MCRIKTGSDVQNYEDLRNMITGLILRQEKLYREEDILRMVKFYIKGSPVIASQSNLLELISDTLDLFSRYDLVFCQNGYYASKSISHVLAAYCAK